MQVVATAQTAPIGYTSIDRLAVGLAYAVSAPRDNASGRFVMFFFCAFFAHTQKHRRRRQCKPCNCTCEHAQLYFERCSVHADFCFFFTAESLTSRDRGPVRHHVQSDRESSRRYLSRISSYRWAIDTWPSGYPTSNNADIRCQKRRHHLASLPAYSLPQAIEKMVQSLIYLTHADLDAMFLCAVQVRTTESAKKPPVLAVPAHFLTVHSSTWLGPHDRTSIASKGGFACCNNRLHQSPPNPRGGGSGSSKAWLRSESCKYKLENSLPAYVLWKGISEAQT